MNAEQTVNSWLAKLNPADARMVLNQYGQCRLIADDGENCIVYLPSPTSAEFFLSQDIAALPAQTGAAVYEELLGLNAPCGMTRGGALAFDAKTRSLRFVYAREIAPTDAKAFSAVLENFLNAAREIRQRVRSLLQAPARIAGTRRAIPFPLSKT